jgi:hypothetical protein
VKLRGPAAIIGLTSAIPRPPFVSAGLVGREQLDALAAILRHPEVARRTPVVLVHHSPFDTWLRLEQLRGGLVDARALRETLQPLQRGLILYGHLHERQHAHLPTASGFLDALCATAAPLEHDADRIRAGFNRMEIEDDGTIVSIEGHVLAPTADSFRRVQLAGARAPT